MKAKTSAQRQQQWREKRKAEGYQMHTVWLEPDVAEALDAAIRDSETKQTDRQKIINDCLRKCLI
jgi:hypothetical protein